MENQIKKRIFPSYPKDNKCPQCGFEVPWLGWVLSNNTLICKWCKDD